MPRAARSGWRASGRRSAARAWPIQQHERIENNELAPGRRDRLPKTSQWVGSMHARRNGVAGLLLAAVAACAPAPARAWGDEGHRVIALKASYYDQVRDLPLAA
jgi:hypothetical protein